VFATGIAERAGEMKSSLHLGYGGAGCF